MPSFFRYNVRVELRCSTAFERPSVGTYLDQALGAWLADKHVELPPPITGSDAAALPALRARLAAQRTAQGADALVLVPTLLAIAENSVAGTEETNRVATRAAAILRANGAGPLARLAADRLVWDSEKAEGWRDAAFISTVQPHLQDPAYADDPKARAAIRLMLADALRRHDDDRARQLLRQVVDDQAIVANDPLKVGALIRLASLDANDGHLDAAQAAFKRSGLSADQCALLDSSPKMVASNAGSSNFPRTAYVWGFEGWTRQQFDIDADGHVKDARAIVAYPPFVFTKAGTDLIDHARYEKSYRPDGGLGCSGETQQIKFQIQS